MSEPKPEVLPSTALTPVVPTDRPLPASARSVTMAQSFQGLIPQSIGEAVQLADYLSKSSAIPKGLTKGTPAQAAATVLSVMMAGMEVGLTPLQAVNNLFVISGNMGMKGNLQLSLIRKSGLLAHFDEGFDTTAADPLDHFGWCELARRDDIDTSTGKPRIYRREFSRRMAMAVDVTEYEGDNRKTGKLADRPTYKSWPERMYPMRARTWLAELLFGDVLKGLTAVENIEAGQVLDAEVVNRHTETQADTADAILADIRDRNGDLATSIESGFDLLKLAPARRLQMLTQFRNDPDALAVHLRDEWGKRNGKGDAGTAKADKAKAAVLENVGTTKEQVAAATATVETKPAETATKPFDYADAGPDEFPKDDIDEAMPTIDPSQVGQSMTVDIEPVTVPNVTIADAVKAEAMKDPVVAKAPALSGLSRARTLRRSF